MKSAWARIRGAVPALSFALGLRLVCAFAVAVAPARWVAHATQNFPRGELALVDNGAGLLVELVFRRQVETGVLPVAGIASVVVALLGLVAFGALAVSLHRPAPLSSAVAWSARRFGWLLLASGIGAVVAVVVLLVETVTLFYALRFSPPSAQIFGFVVAMIPLSIIAAATDTVRAACAVLDGPSAALRVGLGTLRDHFGALCGRYVVSVVAELAIAFGGLAVVGRLLLGNAPVAIAGGLLAVVALIAVVLARAWFLAHVVDRLVLSESENDALHRPSNMSYVPAPSAVTGPGSSVGRAED
ncbi:MAG: hypothetical protein HOW73_06080 [Polyangiaceae bacterium]|nr:hypothetical protein [Polyangiaceae bacterium]